MKRKASFVIILSFILHSILNADEISQYFVNVLKYIEPLIEYDTYQIRQPGYLYPLGWSKKGKLAYIYEVSSINVPITTYQLFIYDLVNDKIIFESKEWAARTIEEQGTKLPNLGEISFASAEYYFRYNKKEIEQTLQKYSIVIDYQTVISPLPLETKNGPMSISVRLSKIPKSQMKDEYTNVYAELISNISTLGNKSIAKFGFWKNPMMFYYPIGVLKSPFENRACIVMIAYREDLEGDNSMDFYISGCHLETGYKKDNANEINANDLTGKWKIEFGWTDKKAELMSFPDKETLFSLIPSNNSSVEFDVTRSFPQKYSFSLGKFLIRNSMCYITIPGQIDRKTSFTLKFEALLYTSKDEAIGSWSIESKNNTKSTVDKGPVKLFRN